MKLCPLCGAETLLYTIDPPTKRAIAPRRAYFACARCGLVFVPSAYHLAATAEAARYHEHHNEAHNPTYRAYQERIAHNYVLPALKAWTHPAAKVLELGGGSSSIMADCLRSVGHQVASHDPVFDPNPKELEKRYDAVMAIEVIEHLRDPLSFFQDLRSLVRPGGLLLLHTELGWSADPSEFLQRPYRTDPTHIAFYRLKTIGWIAGVTAAAVVMLCPPRMVVLRRRTAGDPNTTHC